MRASGYPEMALTVERDGVAVEATYLWGKVYEYGLEKTTFWLASSITDRLTSATPPSYVRPELQVIATPFCRRIPSCPAECGPLHIAPPQGSRIVASMPSESLSRRRIAERLGIPPETTHKVVARQHIDSYKKTGFRPMMIRCQAELAASPLHRNYMKK